MALQLSDAAAITSAALAVVRHMHTQTGSHGQLVAMTRQLDETRVIKALTDCAEGDADHDLIAACARVLVPIFPIALSAAMQNGTAASFFVNGSVDYQAALTRVNETTNTELLQQVLEPTDLQIAVLRMLTLGLFEFVPRIAYEG